jgi:hypothetical protein
MALARPYPAVPWAALGLTAMSLGLAALLSWVRGPASPTAAGLSVLLVAKLAAIAAFGSVKDAARESPRAILAEAVTLGSLFAFVAGLATGGSTSLPRAFLVLDWGLAMLALATFRLPRRAEARVQAPSRSSDDPAIAAAIRDRVVLLACGDRSRQKALIEAIRSFGPRDFLIESIGSRTSTRRLITSCRPDVIFHAPEPDEAPEGIALETRWLVNAALLGGTRAFALIVPDGHYGLAERIVRALSGLTPSRLIRIRLGLGVKPDEAARRVLRVAARGRDGSIVTLGRSGGVRVEDAIVDGGAQMLWEELDRIEEARR